MLVAIFFLASEAFSSAVTLVVSSLAERFAGWISVVALYHGVKRLAKKEMSRILIIASLLKSGLTPGLTLQADGA